MASGSTPMGPFGGGPELGEVAADWAGAGAGDKITWRSVPISSTICCNTWPGGT